jgi:hypothetical protein
MIFYKLCDPAGPHKDLPSVMWDPKAERPKFEFKRVTGLRGVLKYETTDPEMISLLRAAGYAEELPHGLGNISGPAIPGPGPELTPMTQHLFEQRRRK